MTIETTINSGLPMVASAKVQKDGDDIDMKVLSDTLAVCFKSGRRFSFFSFQDEDRIINELIEAQEEEWAREGMAEQWIGLTLNIPVESKGLTIPCCRASTTPSMLDTLGQRLSIAASVAPRPDALE